MTPMPSLTGTVRSRTNEAAVVAAARQGSAVAFEALARHWHVRFVAHGYRLTRDRDLAREAAQSAWIEIAKDLKNLRDDNAFVAWAYRIVTRRCAALIRRRQGDRDLLADLQAEIVTEIALPSETRADDADRLRKAITQLPPGQRAALALHYFDELSVAEVAVALAIPAGTVKTRLMHARNQLRKLFEGELT